MRVVLLYGWGMLTDRMCDDLSYSHGVLDPDVHFHSFCTDISTHTHGGKKKKNPYRSKVRAFT